LELYETGGIVHKRWIPDPNGQFSQVKNISLRNQSGEYMEGEYKRNSSILVDEKLKSLKSVSKKKFKGYEKGNLNEPTKAYTLEACRRVKAAGGVAHCFMVGRTLEQENVDWLRRLIDQGHRIGSHTYDHINVLARTVDEVQYRFQRAPWLVAGKSAEQVIAENIRMASLAIKSRLGIEPVGFRTPGGFSDGLIGREDLQHLLLKSGFTWVSSKYPAHKFGPVGTPPPESAYDEIVALQKQTQPFVYPSGLIEIPMSPVSDIGAFRFGRWRLEYFLTALRKGLTWAIENNAVFDFLCHPSCLYVVDPEFRAVDLICDMVRKAGPRAALVDLGTIAERVAGRASAHLPDNK